MSPSSRCTPHHPRRRLPGRQSSHTSTLAARHQCRRHRRRPTRLSPPPSPPPYPPPCPPDQPPPCRRRQRGANCPAASPPAALSLGAVNRDDSESHSARRRALSCCPTARARLFSHARPNHIGARTPHTPPTHGICTPSSPGEVALRLARTPHHRRTTAIATAIAALLSHPLRALPLLSSHRDLRRPSLPTFP